MQLVALSRPTMIEPKKRPRAHSAEAKGRSATETHARDMYATRNHSAHDTSIDINAEKAWKWLAMEDGRLRRRARMCPLLGWTTLQAVRQKCEVDKIHPSSNLILLEKVLLASPLASPESYGYVV